MNTKSATTAGLLGIFLGSVGAHSWYLGDKKKGIIHVCLFGSGLIVSLLATVILPMALSFSALLKMGALFTILGGIASAAMAGNGIWGLVEGIIILSQGDEGLARKGYAVAQPVMQQPVYGQPMAQPYTQPMQPGYAQQPMPQPQPMQPIQPIQPAQPMQPVAPAEPVATPAEPVAAPAPEVPAEPVAQPVDQPTDAGQNE